ncbi:membrane-associated protein [Streptoalloteichus tenebrarius]|uniref:Membrane-associated protein n=1 Tax=Streptoalloteichus tenebrarius (strain ATCC 17920 / DSM 40477 / JCM 4838 / CBS 697.72 / NBRC 16177 / NCIMB 11028 / NRRL B-12390 / A12253. 1 / ISP 5477) TaxID=1933 RepID=A0ABT1I3G1_STRSD|nr:VTT domain-containing protein [Streptoalloteichus tenebrarius]MCP2262323.1 membrane-associated protein [Streptoalloteichus tenebrarius]BFF02217.1 VTT domain-containing protein [Streptoalloteichus tenebrarius]
MTSVLPAVASTAAPLALGPKWLDPEYLITSMGAFALVGLCLIVFAECGILAFFLPGDSLLFVAGMFVARGWIDTPIWLVCLLLTISAMLGNVTGYGIGWKIGPALFKPRSRFLKKEHVDKTHEFFERHGARAIVLARFVPIVRTFITAMAGVGRMDPKRYFTYSFIGGVAWAAGVTLLGYFLGNITFVKENIEAIFIGIVFVSIIPIIIEFVRSRREKKLALDVTQEIPRQPLH